MYSEQELIKAISDSFKKYKEHGARSTEKLKPLHKYIANLLKNIWGKDFQVNFMGSETKEMTVDGKYYPKDIDIAVTKKNKSVFCVGIKFVTSNYKQNANNYFENMMGETANIQAATIPYAHLIILRYKTPYYKRNKTETPEKIEVINEKDLTKYLKLMVDSRQAHRPETTGIMLIDINEKTNCVEPINMCKAFNKIFVDAFESNLSVLSFVKAIENYKKAYIAMGKS